MMSVGYTTPSQLRLPACNPLHRAGSPQTTAPRPVEDLRSRLMGRPAREQLIPGSGD